MLMRLALCAALLQVVWSPVNVAVFAAEGGADPPMDTERVSLPPPEGLIASPEPDWPQWRGPAPRWNLPRNGLLSSWPAGGPRLVWKVGSLGQGWSSPIVVGQRLYITGDVGDDLFVYAFELERVAALADEERPRVDGLFPRWRVPPVRSRQAASIT